jgi:hypothetical protein
MTFFKKIRNRKQQRCNHALRKSVSAGVMECLNCGETIRHLSQGAGLVINVGLMHVNHKKHTREKRKAA